MIPIDIGSVRRHLTYAASHCGTKTAHTHQKKDLTTLVEHSDKTSGLGRSFRPAVDIKMMIMIMMMKKKMSSSSRRSLPSSGHSVGQGPRKFLLFTALEA